jgi:hypothetical protein
LLRLYRQPYLMRKDLLELFEYLVEALVLPSVLRPLEK